jgi:hypothetical protein
MLTKREKVEDTELKKKFFEKWRGSIGDIVTLKSDEVHQFKMSHRAKIIEIVSDELVRIQFESGNGGTWHMLNLNLEGVSD